MALYKQLPQKKEKAADLPFYRPIDRLFLMIQEKRGMLAPFLVTAAILVLLYGGFRFYSQNYEAKASGLFNQEKLEEVTRELPRSRVASVARVKLGSQALEVGQWDKAVQWLEPVTQDSQVSPLLKIVALQNLALSRLKQGSPQKAIELLNRAAKDPQNAASDYSSLLLAQVYEENGDLDRAKEIYKTLAGGSKIYGVQNEAKARSGWLEKK